MKWGTRLSEQLALIMVGRCALNLSAAFLFVLSWRNSRVRRSKLTYFYSGSSSAPGESDNLTDIIFHYDFLALILLSLFIVRVSVVLSRPCMGLAPLSTSGFPWAAYSLISYNLLISEILITIVRSFHLLASGTELVLFWCWPRAMVPNSSSLSSLLPAKFELFMKKHRT